MIRAATERKNSLCGVASKYLGRRPPPRWTPAQQSVYRLDRIDAAAARSVAIGNGFRGPPRRSAPAAWGSSPVASAGADTSSFAGPSRCHTASSPALPPRSPQVHAIGTRSASVGARMVIGMTQNVRAVDLVVEQVEPEARLRLEIELPLRRPDLIGGCQVRRQSPILGSFVSDQKSGPFPLPALPGSLAVLRPCPTPAGTIVETMSEAHLRPPRPPPRRP